MSYEFVFCSIEDCGGVVDARGLCHKHYERWRRTGTADLILHETTDPSTRFAMKYEVHDSGCHVWVGSRDGRGYGLFRVSRHRVIRAHIFAWEQKHGQAVPEGLELDHFFCDNTSCVNQDHVRPATTRENTLRSQNACAVNARKTECPGHPYDEANTWRTARGYRICKACSGERQRSYRARKKEAA